MSPGDLGGGLFIDLPKQPLPGGIGCGDHIVGTAHVTVKPAMPRQFLPALDAIFRMSQHRSLLGVAGAAVVETGGGTDGVAVPTSVAGPAPSSAADPHPASITTAHTATPAWIDRIMFVSSDVQDLTAGGCRGVSPPWTNSDATARGIR